MAGTTDIGGRHHVEEILASELPDIRRLTGRLRRAQLDSYLVDRQTVEANHHRLPTDVLSPSVG